MVANQHYQRLRHIYDARASEAATGQVHISYGYAQIDGIIDDRVSQGVLNRLTHQTLLSDTASLAAGSVEKDQVLGIEHFHVNIENPSYRGPVVAIGKVMMAEPPRYHVLALLFDPDGGLVADAMGVFEPSGERLPPDPAPEREEQDGPKLPPAPFMPVHTTQFGVLCLN